MTLGHHKGKGKCTAKLFTDSKEIVNLTVYMAVAGLQQELLSRQASVALGLIVRIETVS